MVLGIGAVTTELKTTAARMAARLRLQAAKAGTSIPDAAAVRQDGAGRAAPARPAGLRGARGPSGGAARASDKPSRARSFDPRHIADLEFRAWTSYYLRQWPQVLMAAVGLVRAGFGMNWSRTLYGAWLVLRAGQLWAPVPDNDPDRARACMRRFYGLVRLTYGEPASPSEAARLEVDWWRVHREAQYAAAVDADSDALVESVTRLYAYLYGEPAAQVRPAAAHRARAMELSDQWVGAGCPPDSPLLPLEHAALVRCYAALLAAVHH